MTDAAVARPSASAFRFPDPVSPDVPPLSPPAAPWPSRARPRAGHTMVELLICLVLAATLAGLAGPSFGAIRGGQAVRGAGAEVVAVVEAPRAAALQRGRMARVQVGGNTLTTLVEDGSAAGFVVVSSSDLGREYQVRVLPGVPDDTLFYFDGRGLASPRLGRTAKLVVEARAGGQRDSVCVSNLGLLLPPGCVP